VSEGSTLAGVNAKWHRGSRIGDPENVSSKHLKPAKSETPTGESTWSRGLAGRMRTELAGGS
jgi:hypothetical protein